jgi:hypothetical protein
VAQPLNPSPLQRIKKTTKHAKAAQASAAPKDEKPCVTANAAKAVVMAAEAVVMVAVASAAKVQPVKSAPHVKQAVVVKAATVKAAPNCAKAKPDPHAVIVQSAANALSVANVQNVASALSVRHARVAVMDGLKLRPS